MKAAAADEELQEAKRAISLLGGRLERIAEYEIDSKRMFIIKGLGMFKVNGKCRIRIHSLNKVKIFESEVDI